MEMASKSSNGNEISPQKRQLRSGNASMVHSTASRTQNCKRVKPSSKNAVSTVRPGKQAYKKAELVDGDAKPPSKQVHKKEKSKDVGDFSYSQHPTKETRKVLNKKERLGLCSFLNKVDIFVLFDVA